MHKLTLSHGAFLAILLGACGAEDPGTGEGRSKLISIVARSKPNGATVVLDGSPATAAMTPHTFADVPNARHALSFSLSGYYPMEIDPGTPTFGMQTLVEVDVTLQRMDPIIGDNEQVTLDTATLQVRAHRSGADGEVLLIADESSDTFGENCGEGKLSFSCTMWRSGRIAITGNGAPVMRQKDFQPTGRQTPIDLRVQAGRSYVLALRRNGHISTIEGVRATAGATLPVQLRTALDIIGMWEHAQTGKQAPMSEDPHSPNCGYPELTAGDGCVATEHFFRRVVLHASTLQFNDGSDVISGTVEGNGDRIRYTAGTPENPNLRSGELRKMP